MNEILAYCGLACQSCPVHLATLEHDKTRQYEMRHLIARQCLELYGMKVSADEINDCDGCKAGTGKIFNGCMDCEIRKCAISRQLDNCGYCTDYPCVILQKHFEQDPESKVRLEKIREGIRGL
ncbi:MAG: DUF3795 domain-containing protein [Prolixibacteraceae bacterium]|nr:DUF3795 domain-containing protein [Prolixibacteraceae bacterium]